MQHSTPEQHQHKVHAIPSYMKNILPSLHWRHNGHDSVSNHQPHDCLLNRLFRRRSKKISKLRGTGLCVGNSPETGKFLAQMASNAVNVSIWWRHHGNDPWYTDVGSRYVMMITCSSSKYKVQPDCQRSWYPMNWALVFAKRLII